MATISSLGVGSGLDAESLVTSLLAVEQQPITALETTNTTLQTKVSAWGNLQSLFSQLQTASQSLTGPTAFGATTATSSDSTAVAVATGSGSKAGSYAVQVGSLASAQFLASTGTVSGTGTLNFTIGASGSTSPRTLQVDITSTEDSLAKIAAKITSAGKEAGISASVVSDASGERLVIRGATGADNAFRISVTNDGDGNSGDTSGLSALAWSGSDSSSMTRTQSAASAQATINGISVSSNSNTLSNVIDGLTLTLGKVTSSAVSLNVSQDNSAISKSINSFVSAYNAVISQIRTQTAYDAETQTAGTLQGDSTATGLLRQLRSLAATTSGTSSTYNRLSSVGIDIKADGTMSVNSTKLTEALNTDIGAVAKLFGNVDSTNAANNGIAERFRQLASQVTGTDGAISTRTEGLKSSIERNTDRIEAMEARVELYEKRLRAQYTALDTSMAQLNTLSDYVTNMVAQLNKSGS